MHEEDPGDRTDGDLEPAPSALPESFEPESLPSTPLSAAAPSRPARTLAFVSIVVAGVCGGLIGFAFTDLQCDDGCTALAGLGGLVGAVVAAVGVAIVAVLVLRAMDEWQTVKDTEPRNHPARRRPQQPPRSQGDAS